MEWLKKHADTVVVIGSLLGAVTWMNSRFNEIEYRLSNIEKEVAVIKAVMVMKGIMPSELASNHPKEEKK